VKGTHTAGENEIARRRKDGGLIITGKETHLGA